MLCVGEEKASNTEDTEITEKYGEKGIGRILDTQTYMEGA
jgi:hypothetical protein